MRTNTIISALLLGLTGSSAAPAPADEVISNAIRAIDAKYTIKYKGGTPSDGASCPETTYNQGNYDAHKYTENQLRVAWHKGAEYESKGQTVGHGSNPYPHTFDNEEAFKFLCSGKEYMEFPINLDNKAFTGGSVKNIPDRVIWSYSLSGKTLTLEYCGTIRHIEDGKFQACSA